MSQWKRWAWMTLLIVTSVAAGEIGFAATGATLAVNRDAALGGQVVPVQSGFIPKRKRPLTHTTGPKKALDGALTAVDMEDESLTVQSRDNNIRILIDDHTRFFIGGQQASFPSLKPGAKVSVTFFESDGARIADVVRAD